MPQAGLRWAAAGPRLFQKKKKDFAYLTASVSIQVGLPITFTMDAAFVFSLIKETGKGGFVLYYHEWCKAFQQQTTHIRYMPELDP